MTRRALIALYFVNAFIALACVGEVYFVAYKSALPFEVTYAENVIHRSNGDTLLSIDHIPVQTHDQLEFVVGRYRSTESISIQFSNQGRNWQERVALVPMYSRASVVTRALCGLLYLLFAVLIIVKRPDETAARVVNIASIAASIVVLDTWVYFGPDWVAITYRALYFLCYLIVPVLLLNFGLVFPRRVIPSSRKVIAPLIVFSILLTGVLTVLFARIILAVSPEQYIIRFQQYDLFFTIARWLFGAISVAAFVIFTLSYRSAKEISERKQLRWVLAGMTFSVLFYFLFDELPQMLGSTHAVNEYTILIASIIAPITFTIAVVRYHILNIDSLITRATGYIAVGITVFLLYAALLTLATFIIGHVYPIQGFIASSLAAIVTALLFEPVRRRVQLFVNKTFFRLQYDFRETQKRLLERLSLARTASETSDILISDLERILQLHWTAAIVGRELKSSGDLPQAIAISSLSVDRIIGNPSFVEPGAEITTSIAFPGEVAVAIPLVTERNKNLGILALSPKRSGQKLRIEDIDLAINAARAAALAIERAELVEQVLEEQAEASRQKQLHELKSAFVSSVSHDLKTPLTSIKLFVQLLEQQFSSHTDALGYLRIIDGESDRLKLLIDNVLDHARIERGAMQYHFATTDLNACVERAVRSLDYLMAMQSFTCTLDVSADPLPIEADESVLHTAITNLLSNAMKYSRDDKWISVRTYRQQDQNGEPVAVVEVSDRGIGIREVDVPKVFEPYFRSSTTAIGLQAPGTGLGLANVKHIVQAHRGSVALESISIETLAVGSGERHGTTVSISIPLII